MSLYLANMWKELISERGLGLLEQRYGGVAGNWLSGPHHRARPHAGEDIVLAASTMDSAIQPAEAASIGRRVLGWVLFPDQLIGWDFERECYRYTVTPCLAEAARYCGALAANSSYTLSCLRRAGLSTSVAIVPLGIDLDSIQDCVAASPRPPSPSVHVYWGHMWRTQKNGVKALRVAQRLLQAVPHARISIGRARTWADPQHSPGPFQRRMLELVDRVTGDGGDRVQLLDHFREPRDYWRFLGTVDISYSCSLEESFGVALLEHAAAGAACVCPRHAAYPEVHPAALHTDPTPGAITEGVIRLAQDPEARVRLATAGARNARRFTLEHSFELLGGALEAL